MLWSARSDVTTSNGTAVEIRWMPSGAGVCDLGNFRKNRTALESRRRWWRPRVACGLCPPATAFGRVELVYLFSIYDAALEGPLFHGDVGCKSRARKSGTFRRQRLAHEWNSCPSWFSPDHSQLLARALRRRPSAEWNWFLFFDSRRGLGRASLPRRCWLEIAA